MTASGSRPQSQEFIDAIPVVPYSDIRAAHDFLVDVVGLDSGGLVEHEGSVVHGEVRAGDRRFWLHEAAGGLSTPAVANVRTGGIVLHVPDVDAHFARAKTAGATILREPTDEDYGQREYGLRDPEGHDWYIATPFA
jgi:MerR family transcriptional regulator, thiopeptide resistance regulator